MWLAIDFGFSAPFVCLWVRRMGMGGFTWWMKCAGGRDGAGPSRGDRGRGMGQ